MFFGKPSIFVAVSSDASVNNPSSVSSGNKRNDYDETGHDHKQSLQLSKGFLQTFYLLGGRDRSQAVVHQLRFNL